MRHTACAEVEESTSATFEPVGSDGDAALVARARRAIQYMQVTIDNATEYITLLPANTPQVLATLPSGESPTVLNTRRVHCRLCVNYWPIRLLAASAAFALPCLAVNERLVRSSPLSPCSVDGHRVAHAAHVGQPPAPQRLAHHPQLAAR